MCYHRIAILSPEALTGGRRSKGCRRGMAWLRSEVVLGAAIDLAREPNLDVFCDARFHLCVCVAVSAFAVFFVVSCSSFRLAGCLSLCFHDVTVILVDHT
jgi:hypothetical protein